MIQSTKPRLLDGMSSGSAMCGPRFGGVGGIVWLKVISTFDIYGVMSLPTWRIIPFSKWLVTPIYKPFRPFGMGITLLRGLTIHGY